ncbi:uncharacterized protein BDZ99DRAFT_47101 [Mytilinidion resinicola]|uniref:Uncharacterized protein n=1 Tax=Mytilinidion resinicola TaxID=574789 RepID=A0A6A6YMH4_9PEZI|nr:uncharacterized protein BDZ99DRAFT_47101 [Mytilinidion resinicola]KAF2809194.1 hypothetical protein BDZ99DRAFT_47101 [Mytilinidion resinicola]
MQNLSRKTPQNPPINRPIRPPRKAPRIMRPVPRRPGEITPRLRRAKHLTRRHILHAAIAVRSRVLVHRRPLRDGLRAASRGVVCPARGLAGIDGRHVLDKRRRDDEGGGGGIGGEDGAAPVDCDGVDVVTGAAVVEGEDGDCGGLGEGEGGEKKEEGCQYG